MKTIASDGAREALRSEWAGVVRMHKRMQNLVVGGFVGGGFSGVGLAPVVYNLPLLLAFDVLRQALLAARDEGQFTCTRRQLGDLMDCAKDHLEWIDWSHLREGVRRRNEVAHDGQLFGAEECLKDIAGVESQLRAWGVEINAA